MNRNIFYKPDVFFPDRLVLDRAYLRTCAVFKLITRDKIDKARAIALLGERGVGPAVAEIWFRDKERAALRGTRWPLQLFISDADK